MATDISDLPTPSQTDISDLPIPSREGFLPAPSVETEGIMKKAYPYVSGAVKAGGLAALTPEILTGAGLIPSPISPFLLASGQLARGGRMGMGLAGAAGYGTGQALKAITPEPEKTLIEIPGGRLTRGETAEMVGELGAPLAYKIPAAIVSKSPTVRALFQVAKDKGYQTPGSQAAANELANLRNRVGGLGRLNQVLNMERFRTSPNDISNYQRVFDKLKTADADTQARIAGEIANAEAQAEQVLKQYTAIAEARMTTSKDTAKSVLEQGEAKAQKIINDAMAEAERKLGVRTRAKQAGGIAEEMPKETLGKIGDANKFEADIGEGIQKRIKTVVSDEQKVLDDAYTRDKNIVLDLVNKKELSGQGVNQTPAFAKIVDYIDKELGVGKYAQSPFKRTTEPTIIAQLENIRKAVTGNNLIRKGKDVIEVKGKPPSFNALDQERRKLGEAYSGKPIEGFDALTEGQKKDLYKLIRETQVEYAGGKDGAFDMLLRNYSEGKDLLNALKIPPGKKIIKTDLINPEYMTYDPSGLAREFFSSRKKVTDLVNLTKDAAFVEKSASDHVARELVNADAKKVSEYLRKNGEWLDLMPNLRARVQDHLAALTRAESVGVKSGKLAEGLKTEIQALPITGQKAAEAARKEAKATAKEIETTGRKEAKALAKEGTVAAKEIKERLLKGVPEFEPLVGKGDTTTQIRKLITEGNTDKLRRAAPIINSDPSVRQAFQNALRQEISQMKPETVAGSMQLRGEWQSKIRPAMLETGLIDETLARQVDQRIKTAQLAMEPSAAVQTIIYVLRQLSAGSLGETSLPKEQR